MLKEIDLEQKAFYLGDAIKKTRNGIKQTSIYFKHYANFHLCIHSTGIFECLFYIK